MLSTNGIDHAQSANYKHRIKYVNQWREPRVFNFQSSSPQLLRIANDRMELDARGSANIVVLINKFPQGTAALGGDFISRYSEVPVYIMVTDERGHAEETLLVHLKYSR